MIRDKKGGIPFSEDERHSFIDDSAVKDASTSFLLALRKVSRDAATMRMRNLRGSIKVTFKIEFQESVYDTEREPVELILVDSLG